MSEVNPPNTYFTGIIYNPQFWTGTSSSGQYLSRIGTPTSIATNTTFQGKVTTTDLTVTNVIQGTALNSNNVYTTNNNANLDHYILYADSSTSGLYQPIQNHATFTFNPNAETLTAGNIVATTSMTSVTPLSSDNSTKVATTAYVQNQTYTTLTAIQSNNNVWSGTNSYNSFLPTSSITTTSSTSQIAPIIILNGLYGRLATGITNTWASTNTFVSGILRASTQTYPNNTTLVATTAYVTTAISSLLSSSNTWSLSQYFTLPPYMSGENISAGTINCGWTPTYTAINSAITGLLLTPNRANYTMGNDSQTHILADPALSYGVGNSSIGDRSLQQCTFGNNNSAISTQALGSLTIGSNNCGIGTSALIAYNGNQSVGIGYNCGFSLLDGDNNLFCGQYSGFSWQHGASNVVLGDNAGGGSITSGSNNTFIGSYTGATVASVSYSTAIGNGAQVSTNHQIVLGTSAETTIISGACSINGGNLSITAGGIATAYSGGSVLINSGGLTVIAGGINASTSQTINFGSNAVTMSGSNISAASIPDSALTTNIPLKNGTNTFTGVNAVNNQYLHQAYGTLISASSTLTTLSAIIYENYSVSVTAIATITLPTITSSNLGQQITFRRVGGTTTVVVSFIGNGTQFVYNTALTGAATAQGLMASGTYTVKLVSLLVTGTTYAWFQI